MIDREALYTARWHLLNNQLVPSGRPITALLAQLEPVLGPVPNTSKPVVTVPPAPAPDGPLVVDWVNGDLPPIKDVVWMVPPSKSLPIVGAAFTLEQFRAYLAGIENEAMTWTPTGIMIHNTASPSLAQRPVGFEPIHMMNMRSYYLSLGWNAGPHLFIDDKKIWVFSPLVRRGTHSPSVNSYRFGMELLGDYDTDNPMTGRGQKVTALAAAAAVEVTRRFGLNDPLMFHYEDPKTTHACPGKLLTKPWFQSLMEAYSVSILK